MDRLFRPWRYAYVATPRPRDAGCVLCRLAAAAPDDDEPNLIVARGRRSFVLLNAYPYNTGHLMIVPYDHVGGLEALAPETRAEVIEFAATAERVLRDVYRPDGLNFGVNLGRAAGAGIEDHVHVHAVPRWAGDTNFMTVTSESRVLPEDLAASWKKVRGRF